MKKYEKPQIFYESFELTESIAGNCTVLMEAVKPEDCTSGGLKPGSIDGFEGVFTVGNITCPLGPVDDDYCYWNGQATFKGFAS